MQTQGRSAPDWACSNPWLDDVIPLGYAKKHHSPGRATNDMYRFGARESGGQPHAVQTLREISGLSLRAKRLDCACFSTALERGCAWLCQKASSTGPCGRNDGHHCS